MQIEKLNKSKPENGHKTGSWISAVKLCRKNLRLRVGNLCAKLKKIIREKKSHGFENAGTGVPVLRLCFIENLET